MDPLDQAEKACPSTSTGWADTGFENTTTHIASIGNPARRITDETAPTRRGPHWDLKGELLPPIAFSYTV